MNTNIVQLIILGCLTALLFIGTLAILLLQISRGQQADVPAVLATLDGIAGTFLYAHGSFLAFNNGQAAPGTVPAK